MAAKKDQNKGEKRDKAAPLYAYTDSYGELYGPVRLKEMQQPIKKLYRLTEVKFDFVVKE